MSSGTSSISGAAYQVGTFYCNYSCSFWETSGSVSTANNTSTVSYSASASFSSSNGYSFSGSTRGAAGVMRIWINGSLTKSVNVPLPSGASPGTTLCTASGTSGTITHNADGSKSVTCQVSVDAGSDPMGGGYIWSGSAGGQDTVRLTTIARASTPSIDSFPTSNNTFELGKTITIYMNRASTSFTHDVTFYYGSNNSRNVPVATGVTDQCAYNTNDIAATFLSDNPNATSLSGKIEVVTKNGTTVIGSKEITYTATIPDSYAPTITLPSNVIKETELSSVGVPDKTVVRYISKKKFTVKVTPKNGASIVQVVLKDGANLRYLAQSGTTTTWTGTFDNLETSNISFAATDSRGKIKEIALTGLTLIPYVRPTIRNAYLTRVNASTGANSELTAYGIYYNGTIGSVTNKVTVKYNLNGGSDQTLPDSAVTYSSNNWNGVAIVGTLEPDQSYSAKVTVADEFNQTITLDISLSSVHDTLWLGKKTARVHDYLIADEDVWLDNGADKLSDFSRKNILPYAAWSKVNIVRGSAVWENNGVTLTASGEDCFTHYDADAMETADYPFAARIPVIVGKTYILTWDYSGSDDTTKDQVYIFANGKANDGHFVGENYTTKSAIYTAQSGDKFLTIRFGVRNSGSTISYKNIMLRESKYTSPRFLPYAGLLNIKRTSYYYVNASISATSCTNLDIKLPKDFHMSLGCYLARTWPLENWNSGGTVTIREDGTMFATPDDAGQTVVLGVSAVSAQRFKIVIWLYYI